MSSLLKAELATGAFKCSLELGAAIGSTRLTGKPARWK
jgi:hypothetical protein